MGAPAEAGSRQSHVRRKVQERERLEVRLYWSPGNSCCAAPGPGTQILIPESSSADPSPDLILALLQSDPLLISTGSRRTYPVATQTGLETDTPSSFQGVFLPFTPRWLQ